MTITALLHIATTYADVHARKILTVIIDHGGAVTEAMLYKALFSHGLGCDDASGLVSLLLAEGLLKRVGRVAVAVTEEGCRYADGQPVTP